MALCTAHNNKTTNLNLNLDNYQTISKLYYCSDKYRESKGMSVIHMNVRSLIGKMFLIQIMCELYKPDFLCLTENWLNSSQSDMEMNVNNYRTHRKDRGNGSGGGGIVIYVKLNVTLTV